MKKEVIFLTVLCLFFVCVGFASAASCIGGSCTLNGDCVINTACELSSSVDCSSSSCHFTNLTLNADIYSVTSSTANGNALTLVVDDNIIGNQTSHIISTEGRATLGPTGGNGALLNVTARSITMINFKSYGTASASSGTSGPIIIDARLMNISSINTYGISGGANGPAAANIILKNINQMDYLTVNSYGGDSAASGSGGAGGVVNISNSTSINNLIASVYGGSSPYPCCSGGAGGKIIIDTFSINSSILNAKGGYAYGGIGGSSASGGNGGQINITATNIYNLSSINVSGTNGQIANGVAGSTSFKTTTFYNPEIYSVSGVTILSRIFKSNNTGSIDYGTQISFTNATTNKIVLGDNFVSINASALDGSFNQSATVTLNIGTCNNPQIFYAPSFYTTFSAIQGNGTLCTAPLCSGISCTNGILTFTVQHFDGFGGGDGPFATPEFSTITTLLALALVIGGFLAMRKRY